MTFLSNSYPFNNSYFTQKPSKNKESGLPKEPFSIFSEQNGPFLRRKIAVYPKESAVSSEDKNAYIRCLRQISTYVFIGTTNRIAWHERLSRLQTAIWPKFNILKEFFRHYFCLFAQYHFYSYQTIQQIILTEMPQQQYQERQQQRE